MKLNDEVKGKVVMFLMEDEKEMSVVNSYGGEERVYSLVEVKKLVSECKEWGDLESLLMKDFRMEGVMNFGEVLDCI